MFHLSAFIAGYMMSGFVFHDAVDAKALQRTLSFETGVVYSSIDLFGCDTSTNNAYSCLTFPCRHAKQSSWTGTS